MRTKTVYIKFENKNWGFAGDKQTWARIVVSEDETCHVQIKKAAKGVISEAFTAEISEYAATFGVDFGKMRCGDIATVTI